jgi:hypothetical protein
VPNNRPEDSRSPEELTGVTPGTLSRLEAIKNEVEQATDATGLPGWINGPADAFRHAYLAGRLRQEFGYVRAQAILGANEAKGLFQGRNEPYATLEATVMDHQINQKGLDFAAGISSPAELQDVLAEAMKKGIENGGADRPGALHWLPPSKWKTRQGHPETRPIPPNWRRGAGWQIDRARDVALAAEAMELPTDAWSEAHVRAVMRDKRYYSDHPERKARAALVTRWFEKKYDGGPVHVSAHTRGDGIQVAAHTRSNPRA